MGTMQGDVLWRLLTDIEKRDPELRGVLVRRSAAHALHTRIVGDVLAVLQHSAALNLPAHTGTVDVVQGIPRQGIRRGSPRTCPKRQVDRCSQPTAVIRN